MKWIVILIVLCALFGFGMLGYALFGVKPDTDTSQVLTVVYEDDTLLCYRLSAGYTDSVWYTSFQQCLVKR